VARTREWDEDTVRLMADALEHASYSRELAQMIGPKLPPNAHVCDAGCGLGYLSLELARYAGKVTAVDISERALRVLGSRCAKNIEIRCADIEQAAPERRYDAMVFCLFCGGRKGLRIAREQCAGEVFMVLRDDPASRFSCGAQETDYEIYADMCSLMDEMGIPYEKEEKLLECGQPFRSMEDARLFFSRYNRSCKAQVSDQDFAHRLQATGRSDFPYYMPHRRRVGMLRFRAEDVPEDV